MDITKLFTNGKSQAVRLPKACKLKKWNTLIASLDKFSGDFMSKRIQPKLGKREELF